MSIGKKMLAKTVLLGKTKNGCDVDIEVRLDKHNKSRITTDLKKIDNYVSLSICFNVWNNRKTDVTSCGQIGRKIINDIDKLLISQNMLNEILDTWEKWHCSDLNAGTKKQQKLLKDLEKYDYDNACNLLKTKDLYIDRGYKYASAWLVNAVPQKIIDRVTSWCQNNLEE